LTDQRSLVRQDRILRAVARIASFRRGLEEALRAVEDEEDWIRRWLAPKQAEDLVLAAVERQYERIVNALQDEVFDVLEAEAVTRQLAPVAPKHGDPEEADRWTEQSLALRLIAEPPRRGEVPGRWVRASLLGFLSPELAGPLRELSNFTHRYTRADDEEHGRDVWASLESLQELSPQIATDIDRALASLWPRA